ncbi:mitochondrial fission process protein 1 isoform X2 [Tamandua tetradactyla]|uniref:mitochondrial fission process protein 1 isoform X2 n=1 Tax=Tamandua tetradactyla TaxID=48850 RepID=UPI004053CBE2
MPEPLPRDADRDLYRDTWVRYLGYANEVGEAFRSLVPAAVVWLSYGVSSSYVVADAIHKGKKAGTVPGPEAGRGTRVTVAVVDTFVWQALASVAIPGFTINRVCAASLYVLGTATRWPLAIRKWTTTTLGLLAIPVIIHPIDRWVPLPASWIIHTMEVERSSERCGAPPLCTELAAEVTLALGAPEVRGLPPGLQPAQAVPIAGEAQLLLTLPQYPAYGLPTPCSMPTSSSCQESNILPTDG